jgi:hypothetical protein
MWLLEKNNALVENIWCLGRGCLRTPALKSKGQGNEMMSCLTRTQAGCPMPLPEFNATFAGDHLRAGWNFGHDVHHK